MSPHLQRFLSRLEGVLETPSGYKACCPCPGHGDDGEGDLPALSPAWNSSQANAALIRRLNARCSQEPFTALRLASLDRSQAPLCQRAS
jgi:hypothetical protein